MNGARSILIVLLFVSVCQPCPAQEVGRVRNELETKSAPWVGQQVSFHVDLMSPSFFSGTAHFDLPEIPGVILMKVKGSPTVTTEEVDDDSWSVQRHRFMAFAHRDGTIEIPSFEVRFTVSEGFGKPKKPQRLKTTPMKFDSKTPPGAEGYSLVVSTTELKANETWSVSPNENKKVELFVGDAVSRKITMEVSEVPAMALPRIPFSEIEGLTRYSDSPVLNDKEYRGSLTGQRTESVTYVCEAEGEYRIPGMVITWWNTEKKTLQKESFPALNLWVKPDPNQIVEKTKDVSAEKPQGQGSSRILTGIVALFVTVAIVFFGWRFIERRVLKVSGEKAKRVSESQLFVKVIEACATNQPVQTYDALTRWIEKTLAGSNTPTLNDFVKECGNDSKLKREFELLQQAVIGKAPSWKGEGLASALQDSNGARQKHSESLRQTPLPALNPAKS